MRKQKLKPLTEGLIIKKDLPQKTRDQLIKRAISLLAQSISLSIIGNANTRRRDIDNYLIEVAEIQDRL